MSAVMTPDSLSLVPRDQREVAVSMYLEQARDRLAVALEATGPEAVAAIKAEVATAAEATKQLGLSKEIRDDATEMVRRAEYALGKAIRRGQEEGTVKRKHVTSYSDPHVMGIGDLLTKGEQCEAPVLNMAEATEAEFEDALTEARDEGNLSRANVVRKVKGIKDGTPTTRKQRADLIEQLAQEGYASRQMTARVGVSDIRIREIARDFGIDIPADRVIGKKRRIDSDRVLSGAAESVATAAYSLQQIDPLDLDREAAQEWVDSLTESLTALRRAVNKIKESFQ